ncbi:MAG: 5'-3' exonuclease H3TH domain-containing protein [Patescibacteria group bacterium]|nr:5'-3' exonuclease H3TH domain-containing protein [Patescibacteria group bacterium]
MKTLIIIDSNALIHRAFHALPELTTKKGEKVNAIYGFLLIFFRAARELKPDCVVATFDRIEPTFRHKRFKDYKAKRKKAPQDLYDQIPKIKNILRALNIPIFEKAGFEADDLIGTIAKKAKEQEKDIEIYILTSDLDVFQLIDDKTRIYNLRKGIKDIEIFDEKKVIEKFDFSPKQIIDFKALAGDPSDNLPGAQGIGKETTVKLIKEYKTIENLYRVLKKGEAWDLTSKIRENLIKHEKQVLLSYELAKIDQFVDIDFNLEKSKYISLSADEKTKQKIKQIFENYNFYTLINKIL